MLSRNDSHSIALGIPHEQADIIILYRSLKCSVELSTLPFPDSDIAP